MNNGDAKVSAPSLTDDEIARYERQTVVPELGEAGQLKLKNASVLVIGAGGLGSPLLLYLAGAGVGRIGVVDYDAVEISNLHRQILHPAERIGVPKTESAIATLRSINPHIDYVEHNFPVNAQNVGGLIEGYDIVADGSDNFATRDVVHAACFRAEIPLVSGAIQLTNGILTTFKAYLGAPNPCFRCLYPEMLPAEMTPSCAEIGVLGPAVGALGSMQAIEVIKELLDIGPSLSGTLAMYDAWRADMHHVSIDRRADCPHCAAQMRAA